MDEPNHPESAIGVAIASYLRRGETQQAMRLALGYAHLPEARKLMREKGEECLTYFKAFLEVNPGHRSADYAIGRAYMEQGELSKAQPHLEKARELATADARKNVINDWLREIQAAPKVGQKANLKRLLRAQNRAKTSNEKGRALEKLTEALFNGIAGFTVEGMRVHTETEEIDLVILNGSNHPKLIREAAIVLAECKNWSAKCTKDDFVVFKNKMENRIGRCSLGFLISWNGFADTITKEMLRGSHERLLVVPLDRKQIQDAVQNNSFQKVIMLAWDGAIMI